MQQGRELYSGYSLFTVKILEGLRKHGRGLLSVEGRLLALHVCVSDVRDLFALVWLLARPRRSKEFEILLRRHELAVPRQHAGRPRLTRAERALFAALASRPREPALGIQADRRRAQGTWGPRHQRLGYLGAQGAAPSGSPAGA
jgi:hypothetical protein